MHLASMYADPDVYFDYFTGLLASRPDARVTADVTPAYAMLSGGADDRRSSRPSQGGASAPSRSS